MHEGNGLTGARSFVVQLLVANGEKTRADKVGAIRLP